MEDKIMSTVISQAKEKQDSISPAASKRYSGFDGQYIAGSWRPGKQGEKRVDIDPYSGETLTEIVQANARDLNEAYQAAQKAQVAWASLLPSEREAVMLRSAAIIKDRHGQIEDSIILESGATHTQSEMEWKTGR